MKHAFRILIALLLPILPTAPAQETPPPTPAQAQSGATPDSINKALGLPVFGEGGLWEEADAEVAQRLRWPEESRTKASSSHRVYPRNGMPVAGAKAFTAALYGTDGKAGGLSFVFANKGDIEQMIELEEGMNKRELEREIKKASRDYKSWIRKDEKTIAETLTGLFGAPQIEKIGDSVQTKELAKRWDWNGHTFYLTAPREEYVALRILPTEEADSKGIERMPRAELMKILAGRVVRRDNGDVILSEMPMVNQGPKGYCVPATWERALRYMGIPADMYVLAMAGGTDVGGGTSLAGMNEGVSALLRRYGRRLQQTGGSVNLRTIAQEIDKGRPLLWYMLSTDEYNNAANERIQERETMTDPASWKARLAEPRKAAKKFKPLRSEAHVCMIIGYNKETNEIAVSDSWGPQFAERWVTVEEAQAVSQGTFSVIE